MPRQEAWRHIFEERRPNKIRGYDQRHRLLQRPKGEKFPNKELEWLSGSVTSQNKKRLKKKRRIQIKKMSLSLVFVRILVIFGISV